MAKTATRCLVCGTQFSGEGEKRAKPKKDSSMRGSRMPEFTFSLPIFLLVFVILLALGGGLVYLVLNASGNITEPTAIPSPSETATPSYTPTPATPTATYTPAPSPTPLTYFVQSGDSCGGIAYTFDVSVQAIILQNSLSADCILYEGQELKIPQPTPTITPLATNTPSDAEGTREACETVAITIGEGDTLSLISEVRGVPVEAIKNWNGKTVETVFVGETVIVPLCMRSYVPLVGTTTPTPAPPYPAPELLRPRNGEAFTLDADSIALQWGSVGELRDNEYYQVTVIDLTGSENEQYVTEVKDTRLIVPESLRPKDQTPHAFEWFLVPVAQIGVSENGDPIYQAGGPVSEHQIFIWSGTGGGGGGGSAAESTPTP